MKLFKRLRAKKTAPQELKVDEFMDAVEKATRATLEFNATDEATRDKREANQSRTDC